MSHFPVEDEVTGLAVSEDYIVAQFFLEPAIHVFSRKDRTLLHRLEGHEYGGQALQVTRSLRSHSSWTVSSRFWAVSCTRGARTGA